MDALFPLAPHPNNRESPSAGSGSVDEEEEEDVESEAEEDIATEVLKLEPSDDLILAFSPGSPGPALPEIVKAQRQRGRSRKSRRPLEKKRSVCVPLCPGVSFCLVSCVHVCLCVVIFCSLSPL